jgi:hypothetical protein
MLGFLVKVSSPISDVHAEVGTDVEGGVDVDQLDAALGFDLRAQGAVLQAGEDDLVVASDELVGPAGELAAAGVHLEQERLSSGR